MKHTKLHMALAAIMMIAAAPSVNGRQMTPYQQPQGVVEDLETEVAGTEGGSASAGVLIEEFAKYVEAHKNDPAALQNFVDRLRASKDSLAQKVADNPDPDTTD